MNVNSILNSSIKVLTIITLFIALCVGAIFIIPPVYAVDTTYPIPIVQDDVNDIKNNGIAFNTYKNQSVYLGSLGGEYTCCYVQPATISGAVADFYVFSQTNTISDLVNAYYGGYSWSKGSFTFNPIYESNGIYYGQYGVSGMPNSDIPIFGSLEDALAAVGGGSVAVASFERTITIKPGYVAYIQTDGGTLDLVAQFHEYSRFSRPLWDNDVRISFNGNLVPTSGTTFGSSYGSVVDWLKVASAPSNIMGQTMVGGRFYDAGLPEVGSNNCVVIYNPAYNNANTLIGGGTIAIGPTLTATFSNLVDVSQYALRADATVSFASGASITSGSDNGFNTPYVYIPSENDPSSVVSDTDYMLLDLTTNTSSPAITITAGGSNATADYGTTVAPEEAEKGLLGLLTRILQFLASPIEHIMNLFTAGGNFMAWLAQLWVWLPSDVGALLVDALIVLIVIGVIKFLWK